MATADNPTRIDFVCRQWHPPSGSRRGNMRSRFGMILAVSAITGNSIATTTCAAQSESTALPAFVPLLHQALDTVGARAVRIPGTVETTTNLEGVITLKLVNSIPGSDS